MRSDWIRTSLLRILATILILAGVSSIIWIMSNYSRFQERPIYPGYVIIVIGLVLLCVNQDIKEREHIFIVQMMAYFAVYLGIRTYTYDLLYEDIRCKIPLVIYFIGLSIFMGIFHFLKEGVIKKKHKEALLPSIQVILIFSAYSTTTWGGTYNIWETIPRFWDIFIIWTVISLTVALPEILCLLGIFWCKKNQWKLGIISFSLAIITFVQFLAVRTNFIYATGEERWLALFTHPEDKAFGIEDQSSQLQRSVVAIRNLEKHSKQVPYENLSKIVLNMPNLINYSQILDRDWNFEECAYRYYVSDTTNYFSTETLWLDLSLDSDGDRLTDFEEAELLSNPYDKDTDKDGYLDREDSDPCNPFIESDRAYVHAAILKEWTKDRDFEYPICTHPRFCVVSNKFYEGHGEIANFGKPVVLLSTGFLQFWEIIFDRYHSDHPLPDITIGRILYNSTENIAIVSVSGNGGGWIMLLCKFLGKWHVVTAKWLYMY